VSYARLPRAAAFRQPENAALERDCVLSGGDDYELLFTAAAERRGELASLSAELALPLTRIGTMQAGEPRLLVLDAKGRPMAYGRGFDHFPTP
jgi:thiamine-monophosphate kinase